MDNWHDFPGVNAGYVLELYDRFRQNPSSVDDATRKLFEHWTPPLDGHAVAKAEFPLAKIVGAVNLAHAIRAFGYLAAQLDPLGTAPRGDPSLDPATHGLSEDDLAQLPASLIGGPASAQAITALEAIQSLRKTYADKTGYDYEHIHIPQEREWLRQAAESGRYCPPQSPVDAVALLERLAQVEAFEQFLHRTFPGKTRFSIEGLDMLVPMLDEIIHDATQAGTRSILIGMAHRGRLNILAHVLGKPYAQILAEFKEPTRAPSAREDMGWTGDVKYHAGAHRQVTNGVDDRDHGITAVITMPPNPSHVESTDPVVVGMARAAATRDERPGAPRFEPSTALPVLIHGDAAFPGQGIVAETLNMSKLKGYDTGGSIHIIANNQLGYTTAPESGRSTLFASDLAKGFEIPIVHVNADDPTACIEASRLAFAYLAGFHKDFVIDLIGYRRYGHNEGDEPSFTQPIMYGKIAQHPSVRAQWAAELVESGRVKAEVPNELAAKSMGAMQDALKELSPEDLAEPIPEPPPAGAAKHVATSVPADKLRELNQALLKLPDDFAPNPKLERPMRRRRAALDNADEATIDWATAEQLALASILVDGVSIRFTGEDVERGTFGQRHAVIHDLKNGDTYVPLQSLPTSRATFEILDSPLSEEAALGFEFGYNIQAPRRLVLWEAQYGDFVNAAQMVIDEFIASARAKWGLTPSLTLLLPHGYEGQGPDHSSARLERFLGLAAETNMRIAYPTTAAQYFHLLRRQAALLETDPLPLVVMTPKSLLRHPSAASRLTELADGRWEPVIDDMSARRRAKQIRRLVFCSGKVYADLIASPEQGSNRTVAVVRIEQLYPFPEDEIRSVVEEYSALKEVAWLQEEPENMGAWTFVQSQINAVLAGRVPLRYIGRPPNSSPAEGSMARHVVMQRQLIQEAIVEKENARQHRRS